MLSRSMRGPLVSFSLAVCTLVAPSLLGTARAQCSGDCDASATVLVNELITCVAISLGTQQLPNCTACDRNGDGQVTIDELIASVNVALGLSVCPPAGTETADTL